MFLSVKTKTPYFYYVLVYTQYNNIIHKGTHTYLKRRTYTIGYIGPLADRTITHVMWTYFIYESYCCISFNSLFIQCTSVPPWVIQFIF